jgi:hypothetical protein
MTTGPLPAPFPYFGGKRRAAPTIWRALGDPSGYVEPFAGSAAVLLSRPPFTGRRVETLNDADGWLINTWRAIQLSPDDVARHCAGPITEIDYHARLAWLQERRGPDLVAWLEGDPEHHDPKAAAWWLYVLAAGIGDPFDSGPWRVIDGHLRKTDPSDGAGQGVRRELPHLGSAGQGTHRKIPFLGCAGRGIARTTALDLGAYMRALSDRLAYVRITCGDWARVLTPAASRARAGGDGAIAIFLDPPYATSGDLYAEAGPEIAEHVREWCTTAPPHLRVILAGYDHEHDDLLHHGWTVRHGKSGGGSGYSSRADNGRRERLWASPACLAQHTQAALFADAA